MTGSRDDIVAVKDEREFIVGVDEIGSLIDPTVAIKAPTKLVIPLAPTPAVAASTTEPPPAEHEVVPHLTAPITAGVHVDNKPAASAVIPGELSGDLDALAAQAVMDELMGVRKADSGLVIAPQGDLPVASAAPTNEYKSTRRAGDDRLLNKLFAPNQKRVRGDGNSLPLLLRNRGPQLASGDDKDKLFADLARRPADIDVRDEDMFERIPIEEYGAAMLRGMGVADADIEAALHGPQKTTSRGPAPPIKESLGVGASTNPLLAMQAYEKALGRPRKPGEAAPQMPGTKSATNGSGASATAAAAATVQSKADKMAAIKARKFPGVLDGAGVAVHDGVRVGVITQTEGVPGLEKCKVRVPKLDKCGVPAAHLALEDTEEVIVGKATCKVVDGGCDEAHRHVVERMRVLQAELKAAASAVSALPASDPGALVAPLPMPAQVEQELLSAGHVGDPLAADEVSRTLPVAAAEAKEDGAYADALAARASALSGVVAGVSAIPTDGRASLGHVSASSAARGALSPSPTRHPRDGTSHQQSEHTSLRREHRSRSRSHSGHRGRDRDSHDRARDSHTDRDRGRGSHAGRNGEGGKSDGRQRHESSRDEARRHRSRSREGSHTHAHHAHAARSESSSHDPRSRATTASSRVGPGVAATTGGAHAQGSGSGHWLSPGIRVRITSERWQGGRFFKLKAVVQDVVSPGVGSLLVTLADGRSTRLLDSVPEAVLETALPKAGGEVRVISGRYKGHDGVLLERNADSQQGVIQLKGDMEGSIVKCKYEQVAELVHSHHGHLY